MNTNVLGLLFLLPLYFIRNEATVPHTGPLLPEHLTWVYWAGMLYILTIAILFFDYEEFPPNSAELFMALFSVFLLFLVFWYVLAEFVSRVVITITVVYVAVKLRPLIQRIR